jgi:cobalt-zinc-cadmium efflux system protein
MFTCKPARRFVKSVYIRTLMPDPADNNPARRVAGEDGHGYALGHSFKHALRHFLGREHDKHHHELPKDFGYAFALGTALNVGFVVIEASYGFLANSMALLADAGHNLSDVFGLLLAWGASVAAKRAPTRRFTYGFGSSSILAALINAVFLLVAVGAILLEAVQRIGSPEPVASTTIMVVAGVGIVVNTLTAWLFASGGHEDINIRGAFLHMAADALVSVGVVVSGLLIALTGWLWIDPAASIVIGVVIISGTWGLLRESAGMAMLGVPAAVDIDAVRAHLAELPGVASVHDLHVWPMSTTETALTCHLVMPAGHPGDVFLASVAVRLEEAFAIHHATLQVELDDCGDCCDGRAHRKRESNTR